MSQDLSVSQRGDLSQYLDADWKSAFQRKAFKIDLYQGNTRSWVLPSLSSVLSPGGIVTIELFLFFCSNPMGPMNASPLANRTISSSYTS